MSIFHCKF